MADPRGIRDVLSRPILQSLDSVEHDLVGKITGWGLNPADMAGVRAHLHALRQRIERGVWEVVDPEAQERFLVALRHNDHKGALSEGWHDPAWQTFLYKRARKYPPREGSKARARMQAEVDELYRPGPQ
jgi:hypothetical protein